MNRVEFFVDGRVLQVAIREVRALVTDPRFWVGLVCVVAALVVAAPFDSGEEFTAPQRAVYWFGVGLTTYLVAVAVMAPFQTWLEGKLGSAIVIAVLSGIVAAPPVGALVFAINSYIAGNDNGEFKDLIRLIGMCGVITVVVACLRMLVTDGLGASASSVPEPARLLNRLEPHKRGTLLSLNAQDHYVEIVTSMGSSLVLIRLADAMGELSGVSGMQVHRSWWVAKNAVERLVREDGRLYLLLHDGRKVPVSRANEKAVRAWVTPAPAMPD